MVKVCVPGLGLSKYQSSVLASGVVTAFCVLLACVSVRVPHVNAPPALSVAPFTLSMTTSSVSPAATACENVIGLPALEARAGKLPMV